MPPTLLQASSSTNKFGRSREAGGVLIVVHGRSCMTKCGAFNGHVRETNPSCQACAPIVVPSINSSIYYIIALLLMLVPIP